MKEITLLSQDTIDKIAAGEVVERPASVVKELVENAIDAGANAVTVEIKDGGISLIRITDNGSGIPKEQVRVAFLRHATSKIRTVEDLLTTGTLGFRGEALSSIAAVCQVEMITKTAGSITGVRYVIEGGVEQSLEEIGAPEGTTFLVRNLFYHTPARKKFLKTATTEAGYVSDLMERMAVSHPQISFKFINNRDVKLHTSGNHNLKDIVYGIYGREIAANVVRVDAGAGGIRISGFIGKPSVSRGNRNYENYFVNGRYVRSAIVARAIEDAYKPFLMNHRYPFTVLMIDIDGTQVDVNVHPTKMEVRFADQSEVYTQVYQAVKEALAGRELIPEISLEERPAGKAGKSDAAGRGTDSAGKNVMADWGTDLTGKGVTAGRGTDLAGKNGAAGLAAGSQYKYEMAGRAADLRQEDFVTGQAAGLSQENVAAGQTAAADRRKERPSYPEPFEKIRSQLLAEANSPYEAKYPQRERRTGTIRPVAGNIGHAGTETAALQEAAGGEAPKPETAASENAGQDLQTVSGNAGQDLQTVAENAGQDLQAAAGKALEELQDAPALREENSEPQGIAKQMELFESRLLSQEGMKRHKLLGQLFDTYWLVEFDEKLYIIDQHAAHEKVLYERFVRELREKRQTSQMITPPLIVSLTLQEETLLQRHLDQFQAVGFEIAPFGGREYAISAVPGNLYGIADRTLFTELLDGLTDISEKSSGEAVQEKIASMACKAAVKGNNRLSAQEADALIGELLSLENPYHCPHGRPTIVSMTKYELEKKFKRIV